LPFFVQIEFIFTGMNLKASFKKHILQFKFDAGTSRGVLKTKDTWFIKIWDENEPGKTGIGECGPLKGLSIDDTPDLEKKLREVCDQVSSISDLDLFEADWLSAFDLKHYPSVVFALETAFLDLLNGGKRQLFSTPFSKGLSGIPINGLVWMGEKDFMQKQIAEKIKAGFSCIKIKVGAIDFDKECGILREIRKGYPAGKIILRVDANGAFGFSEALEKLKVLSEFNLHSIEQPIMAGQKKEMEYICSMSPVPIALDEELIGVHSLEGKKNLLEIIKPQYIIIKPTLLGGFHASQEWIEQAESRRIGWWITSALESNIGLNSIAQFASSYPHSASVPQGLGTGQLYHNNIESSLVIQKGSLYYDPSKSWDLKLVD
jgi:o-succinylbenzoate synthase